MQLGYPSVPVSLPLGVTLVWFALMLCPLSQSWAAQRPLDSALESKLLHIARGHNIPVIAVSVLQPNSQGHAGISSTVHGTRAAAKLRWGSITKTVTALTVLALAREAKLDLSTPVYNYVEQKHWHNPWRTTHPVRIIDLLEMRAGHLDLSAMEFASDKPLTLAQALALNPSGRTSLWPPGLQHSYSNQTLGLTQQLIETLSGESYAMAVQQHVLTPLEMTHTSFQPDPTLPGGFKADGQTEIPYWHMTYPAFGALNAPLADLTKLLEALALGQHIPEQTLAYMFQPHGRGDQFHFDYAAGFYPRIRQGHVWFTHGGDADGYRSRLAILADGQSARGYVININVDNPGALAELESVLEAHIVKSLDTSATHSSAKPAHQHNGTDSNKSSDTSPDPDTVTLGLKRYEGTYYPASTRFNRSGWQAGALAPLRIVLHEQQIHVLRKHRRIPLWHVQGGQFRRQQDPVATVAFVHFEGSLYLQGELGNYVRLDRCPSFLDSLTMCEPGIIEAETGVPH